MSGAPGEGRGDPVARRRPEDPENPLKPIGKLMKNNFQGHLVRKVSLRPDSGHWTIEKLP